jgi:hypothetical protein
MKLAAKRKKLVRRGALARELHKRAQAAANAHATAQLDTARTAGAVWDPIPANRLPEEVGMAQIDAEVGEVHRECNRVDVWIDGLYADLIHLTDRLSPVLMQAAAVNKTAPASPLTASQLGKRISGTVDKLDDLRHRVATLIETLAV